MRLVTPFLCFLRHYPSSYIVLITKQTKERITIVVIKDFSQLYIGVDYMNSISLFQFILSQILRVRTSSDLSLVHYYIHPCPLSQPLLLRGPSTYIENFFLNAGLRRTCPNHLKQVSLSSSSIDYTLKCSKRCSILILHINQSQHSHTCYTYFVHLLLPNWTTFCSTSYN